MQTIITKKVNESAYRNYGLLTDISKAANKILGDKSGRTVSVRTAHGFKNSFNLNEIITDNRAEDIAHIVMLAFVALVSSTNQIALLAGTFLFLGLAICYRNGKRFTANLKTI